VRSEERTTRAAGDAHTAAAEAFADRATDRFGEALTELSVFGSTVRGETRGLAYDVMLAYGPVVELHVLTESVFEGVREANPFVRQAVSEGRSYV
jgi:hypothetical protein